MDGDHADEAAALPDTEPGGACSWAELVGMERIAARLEGSGLQVAWRPVWIATGRHWLAAAVAVAATMVGLAGIRWPLVAGLFLVGLLGTWSLEVGGLPSPLAALCPKRATQDLVEAKSRDGMATTLLIVRADLHAAGPRVAARARRFAALATWVIILLTLTAVAGRALEWNESVVSILQLVAALDSLALLAALIAGAGAPLERAAPGWTGLDQALAARSAAGGRLRIVVAGATDLGGSLRALKAEPRGTVGCRCWEFDSGDGVLAAIASNGR